MKNRRSKAAVILGMIPTVTLLVGLEKANLAAQDTRPAPESMPNVEAIIERYIQAVGGREALAKLPTRVCQGKKITDLTSRRESVYESHYFEAYAKTLGKCLIVTWTDAGIEHAGTDGQIGWAQDRCGVRNDQEAVTLQLAYLLNPQGPLQIADYFPGLQLKGEDQVLGKRVFVLEPTGLEMAHYGLYLDAQTGLLVRIGYYVELGDYRRIDGVLFPFRVAGSRKGGSTVYEFSEIRHDEAISDSVFVKP
jgi:hypothetical protein